METIDYLLEKYKNGTASEKEKQLLLQALSVNEQELMKLLEKEFHTNIQNNIQLISQERSLEIFNLIQQKKSPADEATHERKASIFQLPVMVKWLVAACVAGLIITSGWYILGTSKKGRPPVMAAVKPVVHTVSNSFNKAITTILQDGSVVTLEAKSAISYYQPFDSLKRDISLTGKAFFKVAKDAQRPFTVYANGIATTALGTQFWVDARTDTMTVRLLEGKVVVRAVAKTAMQEVFLKPGELVAINEQTGAWAVTTFKTGDANNKPVMRSATNTVALAFDKTPLPEVFNAIHKKYHVVLQYNATDLQSLSFTGTFMGSDSLQTILAIICNTNDLTFKQEREVVVISK